jgi:hypothetical protein
MIVEPIPNTSPRPRDGASATNEGGMIKNPPFQVLGFIPLNSCTTTECREWDECCYVNMVFGSDDLDPTHTDTSSFLLNVPSYPSGAAAFLLQKLVGGSWVTQVNISGGTVGTFYNFGSLAIPTYIGCVIKWNLVLSLYGEGNYRVRITGNTYGREWCLASESFCLREWSCDLAHGTVRFDAQMEDGTISHIDVRKLITSLCGIKWMDSIRISGFFGNPVYETERRQVELMDYQVLKGREESRAKYKLLTGRLPLTLHRRLWYYGLRATTLLVTDYCYNNSDWSVKRKYVVPDGGYDPKYSIKSRMSTAEVSFYEDTKQIRSLCC